MGKLRSETKKEDSWNLESFFSTKKEWEKELDSLLGNAKEGWENLNSFKGKLTHGDPKALKKLLDNYFSFSRSIEKVYVFAHLRNDEDVSDDLNKSSFEKSLALFHMFSNGSSWIEPEVLKMDESELKKLIAHPELKEYKFYLQTLCDRKEHVLEEKHEEILSLAQRALDTPRGAFSALSNADMTFPPVKDSEGKEHPLTLGTYGLMMKSYDRQLRENTFKQIHGTFSKFENTFSTLLAGQVQKHILTQKVRGYKSCLEAALKPHQIPVEVYKNLISSTRKGLKDLHKYVSLRKKILGVDKLHFWDLSVPLVKDIDMKFSYKEACKITVDSVSLLGKEYQEILKKGITEDRWVDIYENKGKRSGAYSSGCYDSMPYILLNFHGMLNDLMTLAHEAGHSMNTLLSNRTQAYHEASYPIFVAEVASTFNEQLTSEYLMENAKTKEEKLFLLNNEIDSIRGTFFRQAMFAEFELRIHELAEQDQPLTKDVLKKIYLDLNRDYFGPDLELDDELSVEFMRVPHFYYNFYVYQYATGISAASALVDNVKKNGNKAYLEFLSSGGSSYPIKTLQNAGVDMMKPEAVNSLISRFSGLVKKFEKEIV